MTRRPDLATEPAPAEDEAAADENFLSRWSRRKQAAAAGTALPEEPPVASATPAVPVSGLPEPRDEPVIEKTDADMPPVESLGEDSDYSGFMSPKVSSELRRLALRKLFHSPAFNIVDGLDDYDDDFRSFTALGDMITADMIHNTELDAEREHERLEEQARAEAKDNAETEVAEATEAVEDDGATGKEPDEEGPEEEESLVRSELDSMDEAMHDPDNAKESPDKESA